MLDRINREVSCNIIASGGVSNLKDILDLNALQLYGAICGKSIYSGSLSLKAAACAPASSFPASRKQNPEMIEDTIDRYFQKSELIPAVVQEAGTGDVLMLAYMNRQSLRKTLETGYTWFFSRSRQELWNKGATSGHVQKVVSITADCDDDTLLGESGPNGPGLPYRRPTAASLSRFGKTDKRSLNIHERYIPRPI